MGHRARRPPRGGRRGRPSRPRARRRARLRRRQGRARRGRDRRHRRRSGSSPRATGRRSSPSTPTASSTWPRATPTPPPALDDICALLASGKNVVSTAVTPLIYPRVMGAEVVRPAGGGVPARAAPPSTPPASSRAGRPRCCRSPCRASSGTSSRCVVQELLDYATYDNAFMLFDVMGFGRAPDDPTVIGADPALLGRRLPGAADAAWPTAMGATIDEFTFDRQVWLAEEAFDVAAGRIEVGTVAALRFSATGDRRRAPGAHRRARHPAAARRRARLAARSGVEGHRRGPAVDGPRGEDRGARRGRERPGVPRHRHARGARRGRRCAPPSPASPPSSTCPPSSAPPPSADPSWLTRWRIPLRREPAPGWWLTR